MSAPKYVIRGELKKKKKKASGFLSDFNLRWFTIQEVGTKDATELALCYYQSSKEGEASGWIYLKDVTALSEGAKGKDAGYALTIQSPARSMTVESASQDDYNNWVQALADNCPFAKIDLKSQITVRRRPSLSNSYHGSSSSALNSGADAKSSSRNDSEDKYQQEKKSCGPPMLSLGDMSMETEENDKGDIKRTSSSMFSRGTPEYARSSSNLDGSWNTIEEQESEIDSAHGNSSSANNGYNSFSRKDDHRKDPSGYRQGNAANGGMTNRLHHSINSNLPHSTTSASSAVIDDSNAAQSKETADEAVGEDRDRDLRDSKKFSNNSSLSGRLKSGAKDTPSSNDNDDMDDLEEINTTKKKHRNLRANRRRRSKTDDNNDDDDIEGDEDEDEESKHDPDPPAATVAVKKKPGPPPSMPPPRRARDGLAEVEAYRNNISNGDSSSMAGRARRSADDLISQTRDRSRSGSGTAAGGGGGGGGGDGGADSGADAKRTSQAEDEEDLLDLKAEMKRYGGASRPSELEMGGGGSGGGSGNTAGQNNTRPPRPKGKNPPPPSGAAPYNKGGGGASGSSGPSTPPRRPSDPGVTTDRNFVTEDWDADEAGAGAGSSPANRRSGNGNGSGRNGGGGAGSGGKGTSRENLHPAGTRADPNWLNEDFDD